MHSRIRQSILVVAAGMGMATLIVGVTIAAAADSKMRPTSANARSSTQPPVDTSDNLHVPADYRTTYQFLGTWAVEPEKAASPKQLHNVYVDRRAQSPPIAGTAIFLLAPSSSRRCLRRRRET